MEIKNLKVAKDMLLPMFLDLSFFGIIASTNVSDIYPGKDFITQKSSNERLEKIFVDGTYQGIAGKHENFTVEVSSTLASLNSLKTFRSYFVRIPTTIGE